MSETMTQCGVATSTKRTMFLSKNRYVFAVTLAGYGVHFWVEHPFDDDKRPFGGVEYHWPKKRSHSKDEPDKKLCWLTGVPCWHDGSSLQAMEIMIPLFRMCSDTGEFKPLWWQIEKRLNEIISDDQ